METPKPQDPARGEMAHIGKSVVIRGELSGSEDLYIDGNVEGSIELKGNRLTIGPNGRVKANVNARSATIQGKLEGNVRASDRVDLKQSAIVQGDIATQRISIEDGAFFKGGVDIQRDARSEAKPELKVAPAAAAAGAASATAASGTPEPRK